MSLELLKIFNVFKITFKNMKKSQNCKILFLLRNSLVKIRELFLNFVGRSLLRYKQLTRKSVVYG